MEKCMYPDNDCMDLLDDDILDEIREELDGTSKYIKDILEEIDNNFISHNTEYHKLRKNK